MMSAEAMDATPTGPASGSSSAPAKSPEATEDLPPQPTTTESERQIIKKLIDAPMEEGATWYLVSYKWWSTWREYVQYTSANYYKGDRPTEISNAKLLDANGNLRLNLLEDYDMTLVPESVWKRLKAWYGGGPEIPRKVITTGYYIKKKMVEIYQLSLKAVYNAKPGEETEFRFSRLATVKEVKAAVLEKLGLTEKADKIKVFNYFASYKHEELVLEATLDDSRLTDGQRILFEEEGVEIKPRTSYTTSAISSAYSNYSTSYTSAIGSGSGSSYSSSYRSYYDRDEPTTPGLVGLMNLGNTCFMNSGLQCITHCGLLVDYFQTGSYKKEINRSNKLGMKGLLAEEYARLVDAIWSGKSSVFAPRDFKHIIGQFAPQFTGYSQHDSQELLSFVLDGLHEDLNRIVDKPVTPPVESNGRPDNVVAAEAWHQHKRRNDSIVVDLMQGQYKSHVQCNECKQVSITFDPFTYDFATKHMSIVLMPADPAKRPSRYYFLPKKTQLFHYSKDLMQSVSDQSAVPLARLMFVYVSRREPLKIISGDFQLESLKTEEYIVAYELPEQSPQPAVDTIGVFVVQKAYRTTYSYQAEVVDRPLYIQISRSNTSYRMLYEMLWKRLGHLVAPYHQEDDVKNGTYQLPPCDMRRNYYTLSILDLNTMRSSDMLDDADQPIQIKDGQGILVEWTSTTTPKTALSDSMINIVKPTTTADSGVTLNDCLELFRWPEPLTTGNEWYCPHCKKHVLAVKTIDIYRAPKILILQLKRFKVEDRWRDKVETLVEFPLSGLDLKPYVLAAQEDNAPLTYDLFAVSNHFGSLGGGHYTAYARVGDKWHSFDDSSVDKHTMGCTSSAYVLFYVRRDQPMAPQSILTAAKKDEKSELKAAI